MSAVQAQHDPRRRVLVLASQCPELGDLTRLPRAGWRPGDLVADGRDVAHRLHAVFTSPTAGNALGTPMATDAPSSVAAGLVINPTVEEAVAAFAAALAEATTTRSTLLVAWMGHGTVHHDRRRAGAAPRHLLHAIDSPALTDAANSPGGAFDPYGLVTEAWGGSVGGGLDGLVMLVDACEGSGAVQEASGWIDLSGEFGFVLLAASADAPAYDLCFSRTLTRVLDEGLSPSEHPDVGSLVTLLRADTLAAVVDGRCTAQQTISLGSQAVRAGLYLGHNRAAARLAIDRGLPANVVARLAALTEHGVSTLTRDAVLAAVQGSRTTVLVGAPGSGKSTALAQVVASRASRDTIVVLADLTGTEPADVAEAALLQMDDPGGDHPTARLLHAVSRLDRDMLLVLDGPAVDDVWLATLLEADPARRLRVLITRPGSLPPSPGLDAEIVTTVAAAAADGDPIARSMAEARSRHGSAADLALALVACAPSVGPSLPISLAERAFRTLLGDSALPLVSLLRDRAMAPLVQRAEPDSVLELIGPFNAEVRRWVSSTAGSTVRTAHAELTKLLDAAPGYAEIADLHHAVRAGQPDTFAAFAARPLTDPRPTTQRRRWELGVAALDEVAGGDDATTRSARANLAHWTGRGGDPRRAVALLDAAIAGADVARVPDAEILTMRNSRAAMLEEAGESAAAAVETRAVLSGRTALLGSDHPDTLRSRLNLAGITADDDPAAALVEFTFIADRYQMLLDTVADVAPSDEDVFRVAAHLAGQLAEDSTDESRERALVLVDAIAQRQRTQLGASHPSTLSSEANAVAILQDLGRSSDVRARARELAGRLADALGEEHRLTKRIREMAGRAPAADTTTVNEQEEAP